MMGFQEFSVNGLIKFLKKHYFSLQYIASLALPVILLKHLKFSIFFSLKDTSCWAFVCSKKSGKIYEDVLGRENKRSLAGIMVACFES